MVELVATTPSSPFGAWVVVRLDILPRKTSECLLLPAHGGSNAQSATFCYTRKCLTFQPLALGLAASRAYTKTFAYRLRTSLCPARFLSELFMKRVFLPLLLLFCFVLSTLSAADEGMWLFNALPRDKVKTKYGFNPSQQWLDRLQLSSVRFNNGGSGSFVSADGLAFTNHHVGAVCVQQLSTHGHDYIKEGFYAKSQAEEGKCLDLELNVLVGIEDVTAKVNAGVKPEM